MFIEIGSNFWLEQKQFKDSASSNLKFKYVKVKGSEDVIYSSSGRGALTLLLNNIRHTNKKTLVPLYTCETVILPFKCYDYDIYFYDINSNLSVNERSFFECIEKYQPGIVYLISYYGFDTLSKIRTRYQWLRKSGITIIEDVTHLLFSDVVKVGADYYVASLRKWLALPDGGVAISTHKKITIDKSDIHESYVNQNLKAMHLKYEYTNSLDIELKNEYRKLFHASDELLNSDSDYYEMSNISKTILSKTDFDELCNTRRNNYKYLLNNLRSNNLFKPVYNFLPDNVVPLYFPVYLKSNRDKFQKYLADKEIYAPVHWPIPDSCRFQLSDTTSFIYNNILSIPCDQRYNLANMDRIITAVNEYKD